METKEELKYAKISKEAKFIILSMMKAALLFKDMKKDKDFFMLLAEETWRCVNEESEHMIKKFIDKQLEENAPEE